MKFIKTCHHHGNNKFHDLKNLTFTVGLVNVKNINRPLYSKLISWLIIRLKVIIKSLTKFDFKTLITEIVVITKIFVKMKQIKISRQMCKTGRRAFIEL